jgi:hypothetical protein
MGASAPCHRPIDDQRLHRLIGLRSRFTAALNSSDLTTT